MKSADYKVNKSSNSAALVEWTLAYKEYGLELTTKTDLTKKITILKQKIVENEAKISEKQLKL